MQKLFVLIFLLVVQAGNAVYSQDTLPSFTVVAKANGRNLLSWTNNFSFTSQISVQKSSDSLRNFSTILTVPDPSVKQNGFVDTRPGSGKVYYRLFIVLDNGKYLFTASRLPAPDTATVTNENILQDNQRVVLSDSLNNREVNTINEKLKKTTANAAPVSRPEKFFIVKRKETYASVSQKNFRKFRDSIVYATRDTLVFESVDTVVIKPYVPVEIFRASRYVYTERYGHVMISLPDAKRKKYSIRFFEEDKSPLFEIEEVPSPSLVIDKTNFVHSGWFWFELLENGSLKERHRFFIPKDF